MIPSLHIRDRSVGRGHPTFFLVEEGNASGGDQRLAFEMIRIAAAAGADCIEFQVAVADDFYVRNHPMHQIYRARELSATHLRELVACATERNIAISASPLSDALVEELAKAGFHAFTINSSDLTNPRILDAVASSHIPYSLGTAMASVAEIDWAVARLVRRAPQPFCLLHGQHVMTTSAGGVVPERDVSLATIGFLETRYGLPVGFLDHTSSKHVPALAVSHGAVLVTKHLAPRPGWQGPDWRVCLTPDDLAECIRHVRLADAVKGSPTKSLLPGEIADRMQMRRSIVAARDLPSGAVLTEKSVSLKRPGGGLDPIQLEAILGRRLAKPVEKDQPITKDLLADDPAGEQRWISV